MAGEVAGQAQPCDTGGLVEPESAVEGATGEHARVQRPPQRAVLTHIPARPPRIESARAGDAAFRSTLPVPPRERCGLLCSKSLGAADCRKIAIL